MTAFPGLRDDVRRRLEERGIDVERSYRMMILDTRTHGLDGRLLDSIARDGQLVEEHARDRARGPRRYSLTNMWARVARGRRV